MHAAVLLLLAATPISLTVDLSRSTTARLGPRVRALIEERLLEEGFPIEPGAKLKLSVEELHGTLRLSAQAGEHFESMQLRPAIEWPVELGFELAQRLAVLAHAAEAQLPNPAAEEPLAENIEPEPAPAPVAQKRLRLSAGVRVGILVRVPSFDPTLLIHGALPGGSMEPIIAMGLTFAPGPGLTAWELPVVGGLRVPIVLSAWTISPELLGGGRLHFFGASSLEPAGGVRFDPIGMLGVAVLRRVVAIKLGLRLGLELSTAREHQQGDDTLWTRGGLAFSAMFQLER